MAEQQAILIMSQNNPSQIQDQEATPRMPDIAPPGMGHPMFNVHQTCMDLNAAITRVESKLDNMASSISGIGTKVDDLVKWKHMILGGVIVIGFCTGLMWTMYQSFKNDYVISKVNSQQIGNPPQLADTKTPEPVVIEQPKKQHKH